MMLLKKDDFFWLCVNVVSCVIVGRYGFVISVSRLINSAMASISSVFL